MSINSVTITNGKVIIDGKSVDCDEREISIVVEGNLEKLNADVCSTVTVKGSTGSIKTMSGDVEIGGDVKGSVKTMSGDVEASKIEGSVSSMSGDIN